RSMTEVSPGVYKGTFPVGQGQTGDVKLTTHLVHPPSGAHKTYDAGSVLSLYKSEAPVAGASVDPCVALDAELANYKISFDFDQVVLKKEDFGLLEKIKSLLDAAPTCHAFVLGHTDVIGEEAYNGKLAKRRADNVVAYLTSEGVPVDRLEARGYGKRHPI